MEIVNKKISELKAAEYNPRKISVEQLKHLKKSLEKFDCIEPAVININSDRKNTIIGGHQRIKAAKSLGWKEFPCIEVNFSLEQEREANIRLNKNTGEFDFELLESEFEFDDLIEYGFSEEELEFMQIEEIGEVEGEDEDDVPEVVKDQIVKKGDIWILGDHRLLCGDATIVSDVDKLMDGKKADMVFTDPPYGMNLNIDFSGFKVIRGASKNYGTAKNYGTGTSDNTIIGDDKEFDPRFILEIFSYCKEIFLWGADYYANNLPNLSLGKSSWLVWDKRHGIEECNWSTSEFELCWSKTKHHRQIIRKKWFGCQGMEKEDTKKRIHPTQKPVELVEWFFEKWGKENDILVDLFGGSGSTLIACEKTKRKCFMMEIEETYCDIIITRWQNFTGNSAILETTGEVYG